MKFFLTRKKSFPFSYLLDYETLIQYMKEEDKFNCDNKLEAGFHYYFYQNDKKIEAQAWYYTFSSSKTEKDKGIIYYWNNEEFHSLDSLIENKIEKFDGYVLIELIDGDSTLLNEFRENHKELDVAMYIKNLNIK